ncbi:hypothetical protein, partial [Falsigemmobacter faecalis]|uniref:hypothetical protein n=1 Tax=Falsigemmobacter faecalis TaxID=2488730 RepID=UPI001F16F6AE
LLWPRLLIFNGLVALIDYRPSCPLSPAGSFHAFDFGQSHGRAAVHDRDADVDFRHLTIGC